MQIRQVFNRDDLGEELYSRFLQAGDGQYGNSCYIDVDMSEYFWYKTASVEDKAEFDKYPASVTHMEVCIALEKAGATDNTVIVEHSW